ncbi:MAG TPA: hypothetical protein VL443_25055 [Cyclobacteriaceae bacterium]|jgi:hypothetical protein|nr:hypothetical protein [Cyclobacteriaceae bacterium]
MRNQFEDVSEKQLRKVEFKGGMPFVTPDKKGYFHRWTQEALLESDGSVLTKTLAIIELMDGDLKLVEPTYFKFVK